MRSLIRPLLAAAALAVMAATAQAAPPAIAALDFELNDLTLQPTAAEVERTATLAPLLREILAERGLTVAEIPAAAQDQADAGFGYLFDHPPEVARLGRRFGADYVAVGRVHKPSFLFVYLKLRLVDVAGERLIGDFVIELKGQREALIRRGLEQLAERIVEALPANQAANQDARNSGIRRSSQ